MADAGREGYSAGLPRLRGPPPGRTQGVRAAVFDRRPRPDLPRAASMFTGLVESLGRVADVVPEPPGVRLVVDAGEIAAAATLGESICVSGCCLSVVGIDGSRLAFQLGPETLARTSLGRVVAGDAVNLERSLRLSDRLGGHLVTGHVDGRGSLVARQVEGDWVTCRFSAPPALLAQMAAKGSVAIDGVSLTLVDVTPAWFSVALIPHTLAVTTLGRLAEGDPVNLETDLVFKYVARWLAGPGRSPEGRSDGAPAAEASP